MKTSTPSFRRAKLPVWQKDNWSQGGLLEIDPRPETLCFRAQTLAIMRHFFELSCQVGRLPSLLGREFFRARVSHHAIPSFEEQAVFVRDVEICLERLSDEQAELITLIGLYDFSRDEIAAMLHCTLQWVNHQAAKALDSLSEIFLQAGVLNEGHPDRRQVQLTYRPLPPDVVALGKKHCVSEPSELSGQDEANYA
jgi:hypothetical protein